MRNTQIIEAGLKPGEQIIWSNQPNGIVRFRAADVLLIVFCLSLIKSWIEFIIDSFSVATTRPVINFFIVVAYSLFIGLLTYWIANLRLRVEVAMREHTDYIVTNKRVLIVSNYNRAKVQSVFFGRSFRMALKLASNGEGSISFGESRYPFLYLGPIFIPRGAREITPIFEGIENVQGVYDTIKTAQENVS